MAKGIFCAIKAWARLTRLEHAILSSFGVLLGMMLASKSGATAAPITWALALLVPICINLGAFALNDYFDIEADRQNKKSGRPLVSGELGANTAILTGICGLVLGSAIAFLINFEAGIIALIFAALSFSYNYKLKDLPIIGNLFIAISMAIAFPFGVIAINGSSFALHLSLILALGAAFAGFGREIVKTVQDMHGDKQARNSKSLPHLIGAKNSLYLAAISFLLFGATIAYFVLFASGAQTLSSAQDVFASSAQNPASAQANLSLQSQEIVASSQAPAKGAAALQLNIFSLGLLAISFISFLAMAYLCIKKNTSQDEIESMRKTSLYALAIALAAIIILCL